jgi:EAL domain-containing protein (putative c-di-GMP-specific phosphodiesterase class I)
MSVLSPDTVARIDCGQRLRGILSDPQVLSMVFQPIIDVVNNEVVAVEALARFDVTPYRSPDVWFNEAHQNGFGVELELLAVTRALAELPMLPEGVALSINAGPETVMAPGFHEAILGVPARAVIVELTEHNAIDDYPGLVDSLRTLRQRGTSISIDDTGSGYSSLAHILKLAPDFIKLDRDLVSGIDVDPVRRALAASLSASRPKPEPRSSPRESRPKTSSWCSDNSVCVTPRATISPVPPHLRLWPSRNDGRHSLRRRGCS